MCSDVCVGMCMNLFLGGDVYNVRGVIIVGSTVQLHAQVQTYNSDAHIYIYIYIYLG